MDQAPPFDAEDSPRPLSAEPRTQTELALEEAERSSFHHSDLSRLNRAAQQTHEHPTSREIYDEHIRTHLRDAIFVGHINTDLDSVAGAIGAAALFGGVAATSEKNLNGEIMYALKMAGLEVGC